MSDLTLAGTAAGQATTDGAALSPFSAVGVTSNAPSTPYVTAVVALSSTANGALSQLGIGALSPDGSTYTVKGSPADVQAALRALVFTPAQHEVPVGSAATTGFTLTLSDAVGAVSDARTSVVATAVETLPAVVDTSATQTPTGFNAPAPFAYVTVTDPDAGATETSSIVLTQNGVASDAAGLLSGAGLTKTGVGAYALAAASPAAETAALQALRFTPSNPGAGATVGVALTVSDGVGAPVTSTSTLGLPADGPSVVNEPNEFVTKSSQAFLVYSDTAASQVSHTYATTIDAVLNGVVLYDATFNLPYADPQVQSAVSQAQAALRNAGASAGGATLAMSSLSTPNSQTVTTETGRTVAPTVTTVTTAFGPGYFGPGVSSTLVAASNPGFFFLSAGGELIDTNTSTTTTVSRTVTTTSTDLLSQQYVVSGSAAAAAVTPVSRISVSQSGAQGASNSGNQYALEDVSSLSADGTHELFVGPTNLANNTSTPGSVLPLLVKDLSSGAVTEVALTPQGAEGVTNDGSTGNNYGSLSGDASVLAFSSAAVNLNSGATDGNYHVYLETLATGAIALVSPGAYVFTVGGTGLPELSTTFTGIDMVGFDGGTVSSTGRYLTVYGREAGGVTRVLLLDTQTHTAVDVASGIYPHISADGSRVAYAGTGNVGAYVYDRATNASSLVSTTAAGLAGNGLVGSVRISEDGGTVGFTTTATNLSAADTDSTSDLYVKTVATGALTLVDVTAAGVKGNGAVGGFALSNDGSIVVFDSSATNLVAGVTSGTHVYEKNLLTGALTVLDVTPSGAVSDGYSTNPSISADGTRTTFESTSDNLVVGDTNTSVDLFASPAITSAAANAQPTISGTASGQATNDKATIAPFSNVAVTDTNAGLAETVMVTYAPTNGTLAGGGFTGAAGSYTASFANAAAAQAGLRALVFTPTANEVTPGQTVTTGFTVAVNDGSTSASDATTSVVATSVNDPPVIGGTAQAQAVAAGAVSTPFASTTIADPDTGQTETVTVSFAAGAGAFAGAGFTGANGVYSGTFASAAAAQAALRATTFTPTAGTMASDLLTVSVQDAPNGAIAPTSQSTLLSVYTAPNTPPTLSGAAAGQADAAGAPINPFAQVTVTDPDAGQSETVTVSFAAGNGALAGGGFVPSAPGVYSVTAPAGAAGASAAAAQADLRAAVFTPTAGQSATTTLTVSVSDGQASATSGATSVVATYTPPVVVGGGTTVAAPPSAGLLVEFQNASRALASGADASTSGSPIYAQFQAEKAIAAQVDGGQLTLAQAEGQLAHLVDGTTAVAVADYAFFTGYTPTGLGLDYLVHSTANATDLNDAYYAKFSTENRYINFAVNLASGAGAGAAVFQANYGGLSLADATAKAYLAVFGTAADATKVAALLNTLVPDGLGGQETRAAYFAQYGGDGPDGQGTKAAMIGFLLSNAVAAGSGVYGAATEHYLAALEHGVAPTSGSELALTYGPAVNLVGSTVTPDPTVTT